MSCAVSCSTAELARPAPNTRNAPISRAARPATRRSLEERVTEDVADAAMTTSVQAAGKFPIGRAPLPFTGWQVSWLAASGASALAGTLAFPGSGNMKRRTIRRQRGVRPRLIMSPPSGFSGFLRKEDARHHARIPDEVETRMECPRHSTVAGSAVIEAPCLGPPRHVPIYSPLRFRNGEPSNQAMIMPRRTRSQSTGRAAGCAKTDLCPLKEAAGQYPGPLMITSPS